MHFNFTYLFKIGTYAVTPNDFLFLTAVITFIYDVYLGNTKLKFRKNLIIIPFLVFFCLAALSGVQPIVSDSGPYVIQYLKSIIHLLEMASMFVLAFFYDKGWEKIRTLMKWWLVIGLISNFYAIYSLFARPLGWPGAFIHFDSITDGGRTGNTEGIEQVVLSYGDFFRATSFFSEPSALAGFNNITILFFLLPKLLVGKYLFNNRFFNTIFLISWIPSQLLTFSLSAVLFLSLNIVTLIYLKGRLFFNKVLPYIIGLIILSVIVDIVQSYFTDVSIIQMLYKRISSVLLYDTKNFVAGESAFQRFASFPKGLEIWTHYPIFGTGIGLTYLNGIHDLAFLEMSFMAVLSEMGLIAALVFITAFIAFSGKMLSYAKKTIKDDHIEQKEFKFVLVAFALISMNITVAHLLTSNSVGTASMWIVMSLAVLVYQNYNRIMGKDFWQIGKSRIYYNNFYTGLKKLTSSQ